jgi:hypothetical protein
MLLATLAISTLYCCPLWSTDLWWHIKTGSWILVNREIPTMDHFSFTAKGQPVYLTTWLSDVIYACLFGDDRENAVVFLHVLSAFSYLFVLGTFLLRHATFLSSLTVILFVGLVAQVRYSEQRPASLAVLLLVGAVVALRYLRNAPRRAIWTLTLLQAVWIPVHGSSLLLAMLLGVHLVLATLASIQGGPEGALVKPTLILLGLSVFLFAVIPPGRDLPTVLLGLSPDGAVVADNVESAPISWGDLPRRVPLVWIVVACGWALWRGDVWMRTIAVVCLMITAQARRNVYESLVMTAPIVAMMLDHLRERLPDQRPALRLAIQGAPVAALTVHFALVWPGSMFHQPMIWSGVDAGRFPVKIAHLLKELPAAPTYNTVGIGGYLMIHDLPVFIDSRTNTLYRGELYRSLTRDVLEPASAEALFDRYGIVYAVVNPTQISGMVIGGSSEWVPVLYDECCALYVRREHIPSALRSAYIMEELRYLPDSAWLEKHYEAVMKTPERREKLLSDLIFARRVCPDALVVRRGLEYLAARHPQILLELPRETLTRSDDLQSF